MTRPLPTVCRTLATVSSMKLCGVQLGLRPQTSKTKLRRISRALRRVVHFGMELHRVVLLRRILNGRQRVRGLADQLEAGRKLERLVAVRHPHRQRRRAAPLNSGESSRSNSTSAWPYSRLSAARTLPPSLYTMNCRP